MMVFAVAILATIVTSAVRARAEEGDSPMAADRTQVPDEIQQLTSSCSAGEFTGAIRITWRLTPDAQRGTEVIQVAYQVDVGPNTSHPGSDLTFTDPGARGEGQAEPKPLGSLNQDTTFHSTGLAYFRSTGADAGDATAEFVFDKRDGLHEPAPRCTARISDNDFATAHMSGAPGARHPEHGVQLYARGSGG